MIRRWKQHRFLDKRKRRVIKKRDFPALTERCRQEDLALQRKIKEHVLQALINTGMCKKGATCESIGL